MWVKNVIIGVSPMGTEKSEGVSIMMTIEKLERLVDLSMRIGTSVGATGAVLTRLGGQLELEEAQEWERLMEEVGLDPFGNDEPDN